MTSQLRTLIERGICKCPRASSAIGSPAVPKSVLGAGILPSHAQNQNREVAKSQMLRSPCRLAGRRHGRGLSRRASLSGTSGPRLSIRGCSRRRSAAQAKSIMTTSFPAGLHSSRRWRCQRLALPSQSHKPERAARITDWRGHGGAAGLSRRFLPPDGDGLKGANQTTLLSRRGPVSSGRRLSESIAECRARRS